MSDTYEYPAEAVQKWNEQNKAKDDRITTLLAVIEQCEKALDRNKSKFEMVGWKPCGCPGHWDRHACGISDAIFDCTQALAAIKKVKESK